MFYIYGSGRSPKMNNHERFAQVAHQNEWPWANCSGPSPKMSDLLRKPMSEFPALVPWRRKWMLIATTENFLVFWFLVALWNGLSTTWIFWIIGPHRRQDCTAVKYLVCYRCRPGPDHVDWFFICAVSATMWKPSSYNCTTIYVMFCRHTGKYSSYSEF